MNRRPSHRHALFLLLATAGAAGWAAACGSDGGSSGDTGDDGGAGANGDGASANGDGAANGDDASSGDDGGAGANGDGASDGNADGADAAPTVTSLSSGSVPANAASLFDPSTHTVVTTDPNVPTLVYPVTDTMFPQNIYRVLFQWAPHGLQLFELSFTSPTLSFSVYTDGVQATCAQAATGGACWESTQSSWQLIAGLNAGQTVTLKIRGLASASSSTMYESPVYTFHFSRQPVPGAIYYWSTTAAGVRRGALGDSAPTNFFTPAQAQGKCVACHTISRNGKRLAGDVGGENLNVAVVSATTPPPIVFGSIGTPATTIANAWATFNPDTSRVVNSEKGIFKLRDGTTGATIGANGGAFLPPGVTAIQPDWSPDGAHLVFARGQTNDRGGGVAISWLSASGDTFGGLQDLLTAASGESFGYPMFDPTSAWIAFVRGTNGINRDVSDQVYVMPAQPGATRQQLVRADTLVNDGTVTTGIENNMPTWAPSGEAGLEWVAFASTRDYGYVLRSGSKIGSGVKQLWIAAIDTSKLGSGDPSYPAFRIPFVDLNENCHRPFWAEDAIVPPDAGAPDAGPQDAGACVPQNGDCTAGVCCGSFMCLPSGTGYTCQAG